MTSNWQWISRAEIARIAALVRATRGEAIVRNPSRQGFPWSEGDDFTLEILHDSGIGWPRIAEELGRTESAARSRLQAIRLPMS